MTIYAIGDIHGHLDQLRAAHDRVAGDRAGDGARGDHGAPGGEPVAAAAAAVEDGAALHVPTDRGRRRARTMPT